MISVSKDTRYTLHTSINQLRKDTQETDGVVACEEKNWVAGDGVRGHGTDVTGYFFCIL